MRFKRIMSMFIAALCVLNLVPAVFTTNELKAAIALNARLDANLTTSESSDTPVINYQSANLPSDTVYLSYAFPTSENKPVILSYLLDPVTKVAFELSFDEINGIYTAYYRLSKYTNGLWEQQPFSPTVYNYLEKGFLPADEYMGYTPESSKNQVIKADTDTDSSNDSDGYYFQFISGAGFGITYSGRQIFFYADALGNIHYGTNGIREGYIYNFDIIDGTNDTVLGEQSVYSGINRDTLDFIPIANGETGAIQAPAYFNTYPLRNDDTYVLDNSAGEIPAEDQVGMVIRFDEPMVLDFDTMGTPSVLSAADVDKDTNSQSDYKIDVTFDMLQNLGRPDSSVRIRVNDILRLTETETIFTDLLGDETSALFDSVEILDDENINDTSTVRFLPDTGSAGDPRRVQVTVNNLLDGMLFSNMSVTSIMYNPVNTVSEEDMALGEPPHFNAVGVSKTAGSPIPFGKAFTFLKYGFFYDGVKFSLQFTPYKGFEGNYDIYIGTESARQVPSDGTGFISVDLGVPLNDEYQVFFAPETLATGGQMDKESMVYSEVVRYDPDGADINLGAARDFRIDEYTLKPVMPTPDDEDDGSEGTLDISMSWQLGMESAIHNMWDAAQDSDLSSDEPLVVKYALNKSLTGTDGEDTAVYGYAYIEITKEPDPVTGLDEYYASFTIVDQSIGYDNFIAESFDPNNPGVPTYGTGKNELLLEAGMYRVNVDVKDIPAQRDAYNLTNVDESRFFYEKIYFLCVETLPAGIDDINKKSNFDSMSLSDVIYGTIPPVKDLQEDKPSTYRDSFKVSWVADMEQLYEYFHNSPFDSAKAEFNFNVFISQNEEEMTDLSRLTPEELSELFSAGEQAGNYFDYAGAPWVEYAIDITGEQLSLLRDDEVVRFGGLNVTEAVLDNHLSDLDNFLSNLTVNGLDENQTYYVYVNFEVTHNDITDEDLDKTRSSILSSLIGITTKGEPKPPDGGDKRPGAPDVMIRDVTTDSATVYWNFTTIPEEDSTDKVYYEIVRTTGEQIPMKFVDSYIAFPDLYDQLIDGMGNDAGIVVLQTPEDNMGSELTVVHGSNVNASDFEIIFTTNGPEIRDKSLTSNEIYFYYVRTVREVTTEYGVTKLYSVFNYNTCTTDTVTAPINLRILDPSQAEFDLYRELVMNFDVLLENLKSQLLDGVYRLEYSIKADDGEFSAPINMTIDPNNIKDHVDELTNITYKVSGLSPGTLYTVRVRLVNAQSGDTSAWSNTAQTRTDVDQDDYFDERLTADWTDYYRQMLEKLIKDPYWVIQDSSSSFSAVYRPTMFDNYIGSIPESRITLPTGANGASSFVYYIPAASLESANNAQKGFVSVYNNLEVIISKDTVSTQTNETIFTMLDSIDKNTITDYYLMISIDYNVYNMTIGEQMPLTENVIIEFDLVGSREMSTIYDDTVLNEYINRIEAEVNSDNIQQSLFSMVQEDNQSERIIEYLTNAHKAFAQSMITFNNAELRTEQAGTTGLDTLDAPMIIVVKGADITVNTTGYKWENNLWNAKDTVNIGAGKGFYTSLPGSYIFAGVKIVIDGASTMPGAQTAYTIISKYGLTDFLGVQGNIDLDAMASRSTVLGAAARMMGAPKGGNPVEFFKAKGYIISGAGMESMATTQETIYVVMAVYENKTKTDVSTLQIRNHTVLNGITGINERYTPYIKAAYELGIYNKQGMMPRANVTVRELLDMLTVLDTRANL